MPSLLNDDNAQQSLPTPASKAVRSSQHNIPIAEGIVEKHYQPQSPYTNEISDGTSSHSSPTSTLSESTEQMTSNLSDATTMSADRTDDGPNSDAPLLLKQEISRKPVPNGNAASTTALADRTVAQPSPLTNGTKAAESASTSPKEGQPRTSLASTRASSVQTSPVEMYIRQVSKSDIVTVDNNTTGLSKVPSNGPTPVHSSTALPSTIASNPELSSRNQSSPHRFSSPPQYHAAASGSTATASGSLHPPPPAGLKHRHTLEVPRLTPGRSSRDGIDSALASGRFSPTTATTPAGIRRASLSLVRRNTRSLHSDLPRDEVVPDEDALRWAEAIRQKRASKRKRMEQEDDDRVLVGTKVDENHANWVTAYNMLTGIRVSVSRTNAKLDRDLTDADFEAKQKSTFDM
jgi:1-phosphatidylinositol-4-phosphate 5-kinase